MATDLRETQKTFKAVEFDGGALINHLSWLKVGTMETVCGMYVDLITRSNSRNNFKVVVFDRHEVITTKLYKKKCRRLQSDCTVDVSITSSIPILGNQSGFLSNHCKKHSFVNILRCSLERKSITAVHTKDMRNADVTIIN